LVDATVITLGGFAVFNSEAKKTLIKRISQNGVILFTDPDGAGKSLRSYISGILPKDKIYQAYVPKIAGKEKRKSKASNQGFLGVEGVDKEYILKALEPYILSGDDMPKRGGITKLDFYSDGFSGGTDSSLMRKRLATLLDLPDDLTANALLDAINLIITKKEYDEIKNKCK
jgi:ribonuclease M5